jgi:Tfp pilus assembly protein PilF
MVINVDAKPGEVITGERKFKVTVQADDPVTQVEFYVGADLRDSDTSTPYEFRLDTLNEKDGPLKLVFKAYTTEGASGSKVLDVKIDNQISKGAGFHVQRATELLSESKWSEALTAGRLALKADPNSNPARLVLARANLGLKVYDQAQKYAEDAAAADPKDRTALDLLSVVDLQRAFNTYAKEGADQAETRAAIAEAIKAGVEARRKSADLALEAVGQPTDANLIAYADAAIAGKRYSLAAIALQSAFEKDERRVDVGNRLAYAYVREGRYKDALTVLRRLQQQNLLDAYSNVLLSVVYAETGDIEKSDAAMRDAMVADPKGTAVRAAQAYIALKFVRTNTNGKLSASLNYDRAPSSPERQAAKTVFQQLATELGSTPNQTTEIGYYLGALYNKLEEFNRSQSSFEKAALADPLNYDAFIEEGNRSLLIATTVKNLDSAQVAAQYANAKAMFEAALAARDDSAEALTGLAIVSAFQGNTADAYKWARAAVGANKDYAAARVAHSLASQLVAKNLRQQADKARQDAEAPNALVAQRTELLNKARDLEKQAGTYEVEARTQLSAASPLDPSISGQEMSDVKSVWRYYSVGGRRAVIPAPRS